MCLAIPAQILSRDTERARVNCNGLELDVDVSLVPEARVGDFVIVHVGIALSVMNSDEALETIEIQRQLSLFQKSGSKP